MATILHSGSAGGRDYFASGASLAPGSVGSGDVTPGSVGSIHLDAVFLASLAVQQPAVAASGADAGRLVRWFAAAELISGLKAVTLASGSTSVVRAERQSGLRLPALGVTVSGAASGQSCEVVLLGPVTHPASGMLASGFHGLPLYVGSGGLLVGRSGLAGASSGPGVGAFSGSLIQPVGLAVSGGIWVCPGPVRLAPVSGTYLRSLSGQYPVSGYF